MSSDRPAGTHAIHIERTFSATPERVFRYWVDSQGMRIWFAPKGYTILSARVDARPGGSWDIRFRSDAHPDQVYDEFGTFREVIAPTRVVFTLTQRDRYGSAGPETIVTVELSDTGRGTHMRFTQEGFDSVTVRDDHIAGLHSCFDKLDIDLARGGVTVPVRAVDTEELS